MKKLFFVLINLTFVFQGTAQDKKWTLPECVLYALENNISIQQSELDVEATDIERLTALGAFLPSLNLGGSLSENTGLSFNPVTNSPETTTFLSANGNINVGYTLFNGLRNYRQVQRAEISKLASQYRLDKMKDDIALFVANGYLQVLLNKANLNVIEAQNQVTKQQIKQTQDLVDAGVLPRGDLLEIQATDASELQRIAVARNTVQISLISLAQLLLLDEYETFDIADDDYQIINTEMLNKSPSEIIEAAKQNRDEINIANANVELAEKDVQIAKTGLSPTLTAFFGYNTRFTDATSFRNVLDQDNPFSIEPIGIVEDTGQTVVGQFPNTITEIVGADPFFDQLSQNDGVGYGLSLNIPIFNGFSVRGNIKRSEINLRRTQYQLEQAALDLESNIYQAYVDAQGSLAAYEAAQKAVESQELAYQYATDRYDAGVTNAFDFSQSKLRYDNSVVELNRAKYDYIFKLKVLELFFGIDPTELKF